jgi:hypothetical protein
MFVGHSTRHGEESGGMAPLILNQAPDGGELSAPSYAILSPGKKAPLLIEQKTGDTSI